MGENFIGYVTFLNQTFYIYGLLKSTFFKSNYFAYIIILSSACLFYICLKKSWVKFSNFVIVFSSVFLELSSL